MMRFTVNAALAVLLLAPSAAGEHQLVIDLALEDLAGNRIDRTFDVDTFDSGTPRRFGQTLFIPFRVSR